MNLYIATKFNNRFSKELLSFRQLVGSQAGIQVVSRWLDCTDRPKPDAPYFHDFIRAWGEVDKADLDQCDTLLLWLTDMEGSNGGCHWEAGYMFGRGKKVVVYSPTRILSPFYTFADVTVIDNLDDLRCHFLPDLYGFVPRTR